MSKGRKLYVCEILVHLFMEYICEYICILLFVEMK